MNKTIYISILLVFMLLSAATAQGYTLDWEDRYVDEQASSPAKDQTRRVAPQYRAPAKDKDEIVWEETHSINIVANQNFDNYNNRYRKVARVETLVYRGGYPADLVHCNRASYDTFNVVIDDLEVGDRYEVRVTWDDGSHRTIENTVTEYFQSPVFIDEPLYFDSAFGS